MPSPELIRVYKPKLRFIRHSLFSVGNQLSEKPCPFLSSLASSLVKPVFTTGQLSSDPKSPCLRSSSNPEAIGNISSHPSVRLIDKKMCVNLTFSFCFPDAYLDDIFSDVMNLKINWEDDLGVDSNPCITARIDTLRKDLTSVTKLRDGASHVYIRGMVRINVIGIFS